MTTDKRIVIIVKDTEKHYIIPTTETYKRTLAKHDGYYHPDKINSLKELKTNADGYNSKHQKIFNTKRKNG